MKITFKRQKRNTGLYAVGNPYPSVDIKLDGKIVGNLDPPNWQSKDNCWQIALMVKKAVTPDSNCDWKWIRSKTRYSDEEAARMATPALIESVSKLYTIHSMED